MLASSDLIPAYDMLGLPMPAWLAQFLMGLTLAVHWALLTATAGGAAAYLAGGPGGEAVQKRRRALAVFLPYGLAMAMTVGIAPLLFVQVLYGQFFYTANILKGYAWLALLAVMAVLFYVLYAGIRRRIGGRPARFVGVVAPLLMALVAVILSANATLTQNPGDWESVRSTSAAVPYMKGPTFAARWTFAMFALIAGGGLFVAAFTRGFAGKDDSARPTIARSVLIGLAGLVGMLACGLWGSFSMPEAVRKAVLGGPEAAFAYAAAAAVALTGVLAVLAWRNSSLRNLVLPCVTFFVALLSCAFLRDTMRRAALAEHFDLSAVPVHSQWTSFGLFAVIFVAGLGLIAYLIRLAYVPTKQAGS
jgi:hypothetical protein